MNVLQEIKEVVLEGEMAKTRRLVEVALRKGIGARQVLDALIEVMAMVRRNFENREIYLPDVLLASRAMKTGMDVLEPALAAANVQPIAKIVLGSVQGDMHSIGHMIVGIMLRGAGFQVIELGEDVPVDNFVRAVESEAASVLGISCLVTHARPSMMDTIHALETAGVRDRVKIIIGGATVTQSYADKIGADGYAPDAALAVEKVKELLMLS